MSATISPTSPQAWLMSLTLHGLVAGLIALVAYTARLQADRQPKVLELVAGPGEDYGAKEAPALGSETGIKLAIPKVETPPSPPVPTPQPAPVQPIQETAPPIVPAPTPVKKEAPKPVPKKEADPATNFARQIQRKVDTAKKKAQVEAAKERKKEQDRLTKEQFDRMNAAKKVASAAPSKSTSTKYKPVDVKGIRDGVAGGSSASTKGAGGRALTREDGSVQELYDAELLLKLRRAFEEDRPPGLSDSLRVTIEVRSNANGSLTNARVTQPSGSPEFDRAVLDAVRRVRMPPRSDKRSETISFVFTMREE